MREDAREEVLRLNDKYEENYANGVFCKPNYKIIEGSVPILFSAPHSVIQIRNAMPKVQDSITGGIVEYLAREYDCYGITRLCNRCDDPNWDLDWVGMEYKEQIVKLVKEKNIRYFFDIHAASDRYGFGFCLGTNEYRNLNGDTKLLENMQEVLGKYGIISIDVPFSANSEKIVSMYVAKNTGIPAVQIEISQELRFAKLDKCMEAFDEMIKVVESML